MEQTKEDFLISMPDFERIFRTVHGMLLQENSNPALACDFFSVVAASILNIHHGIECGAMAGFAAYKFDNTADLTVFGAIEGGTLTSNIDGYHCWVQCKNWVLDFTLPLLPETLAAHGTPKNVERRMFQKRLADMRDTVSELRNSGDYLYGPNQALSKNLVRGFFSKPAYKDIMNICLKWYRPVPETMEEAIDVGDKHGKVTRRALSPLMLSGAW